MIRQPAVAGHFYPNSPQALREALEDFVVSPPKKQSAIALVVPHAGYMYSGHVAGAVYARIELPARIIILCPNHTGLGVPLSIMRTGAWQTPLGEMQIDTEMCDALIDADSSLEDDVMAHRMEHAIEVHLPFIQYVNQYISGTQTRFAPIVVGTTDWDDLSELGEAIATTIAKVDRSTLIIASSDMNHYESDAVTRVKDHKAIDPMLKLDPRGLYDTVRREKISMCGLGPATATIVAANRLGAQRAELVQYATSADVSGDFERVVGYAGMILAADYADYAD